MTADAHRLIDTARQIETLVAKLRTAYDAATPGRSKRWWAGGFGWLRPGVGAEDAVTAEVQAFIVLAHNEMPKLLEALDAATTRLTSAMMVAAHVAANWRMVEHFSGEPYCRFCQRHMAPSGHAADCIVPLAQALVVSDGEASDGGEGTRS